MIYQEVVEIKQYKNEVKRNVLATKEYT